MIKTCTKCDRKHPATAEYFYRDKSSKDGLRCECKKCTYLATQSWSGRNREKCREGVKKYQRKYIKTLRGYVTRLIINVKQRCINKNCPAYKDYGGRGIKCLFTGRELYDWLIKKRINPRDLHIHRINNNGDYSLDNITFLTASKHAILHRAVKV